MVKGKVGREQILEKKVLVVRLLFVRNLVL